MEDLRDQAEHSAGVLVVVRMIMRMVMIVVVRMIMSMVTLMRVLMLMAKVVGMLMFGEGRKISHGSNSGVG